MPKFLGGTIWEVVLNVTIKYASAVAICACVAEFKLMMQNAKKWWKMHILAKFSLKTL